MRLLAETANYENMQNAIAYKLDSSVKTEINGSGIMILEHTNNLSLSTKPKGEFRGIVYILRTVNDVNNIATIFNDCQIRGMLISEAPIWFSNIGSISQVITYDADAIQEALAALGSYRQRGPAWRIERGKS